MPRGKYRIQLSNQETRQFDLFIMYISGISKTEKAMIRFELGQELVRAPTTRSLTKASNKVATRGRQIPSIKNAKKRIAEL